jgi:hypothetical protein
VQTALDADIVMVFDECTPYPASETVLETDGCRRAGWLKPVGFVAWAMRTRSSGMQGGTWLLRAASLESLTGIRLMAGDPGSLRSASRPKGAVRPGTRPDAGRSARAR